MLLARAYDPVLLAHPKNYKNYPWHVAGYTQNKRKENEGKKVEDKETRIKLKKSYTESTDTESRGNTVAVCWYR